MRVTSMAIALAATLALPTLAMAQAGLPPQPYPRTDKAGTPPGASKAQGQVTKGQVTNRPRVSTGEAGPAPTPAREGKRKPRKMIER
jgi:hypothetical protein